MEEIPESSQPSFMKGHKEEEDNLKGLDISPLIVLYIGSLIIP